MKDSAEVVVATDPRIPIDEAVLKQKYDLLKELEKKTDLAYRSVEQLKASKALTGQVKSLAEKIDKELYKELIESTDSIGKKIDRLMDDMLGKEDKRQGITAAKDPSTISHLRKAVSYVGSLKSRPGQTEMQLIENANAKVDPVVGRINEFYKTEWLEYRTLVEAAKLSLFKDYEILK
jgi:hypothetical protein